MAAPEDNENFVTMGKMTPKGVRLILKISLIW